MERKRQAKWRTTFTTMVVAAVLLVCTNVVSSTEVSTKLPTNHKDDTREALRLGVVDGSKLKMEARVDDDGMDLNVFERKDQEQPVASSIVEPSSSQSPFSVEASYVTPVPNPAIGLESKGREGNGNYERNTKPVVPAAAEDRGWRSLEKDVKPSAKDSYLDALMHSHTSNDPNEGVVRADVKPKVPKIFRREYHQGPVYRPEKDYGAPKDPNLQAYGAPNTVAYEPPQYPSPTYGVGPTQSAFLPTPSDSYSLPVQSHDDFDPRPSYVTPQHFPQSGYSVPDTNYGAPTSSGYSYGQPSNGYLPPAPSSPQQGYGPPAPAYGPPAPAYGSPAPVYGAPYALPGGGLPQLPSLPMVDFSWPIALKLNAFTVAKIILKLVIFKMIVKFIAVICLLLFIPKLEIIKKGDKDGANDEEEGYRNLVTSNSTLDRLNLLTSMVLGSIENHERSENRNENQTGVDGGCDSFGCRLKKAVTFDESWSDYVRLIKSYVADEVQQLEHRTKET